jgi:hypothetical protein
MSESVSVNGPTPVEPVKPTRKIVKPDQDQQDPEKSLKRYQPEDLWIDPAKIHAAGAVNRPITTIPIRKPNKHEFVRTHRNEEFWRPVAFIELERILYVVHPNMVCHLDADDIFYARLCLAISRSGEVFFWPLKMNKGRANLWNDSALEIAKLAIDSWVKIRSRQEDGKGGGYYEAEIPIASFGDPVWPDLGLKQLYDIAFKGDRIVDRIDHLVIQKLTGQIK